MAHRKPLVVAVTLGLSLLAHEAAAQLADPTATRSTTQVVKPPPPPPPPPRAVQVSPPATPSPMPTQLGQRAQPTPVATPASPSPPQDDVPARRIGAQPARVYDRNGRVLESMEQAGPNRVRDTRTGRYYDTVPMGDGQRIQPSH